MTDRSLLSEQIAYYRAVANEYETHAIPVAGGRELVDALEAFAPTGHVLELACGTGIWTERLARHATSLTAVDASPEMLARTRARIGDAAVELIEGDLFQWRPARRYDVVFFGFWLSHVPRDRFAPFWQLVADCLEPGGRVFFCDDNYRTADELIEGEASATIRRRLNDGTAFSIIKIPYKAAELERDIQALGWQVQVRATSGPFYWGTGALSPHA